MAGLEWLGGRAASIISILAVLGITVGFLDARHEKAGASARIMDYLKAQQIESYEAEISKAEAALQRLQVDGGDTERDKLYKTQLKDRKAEYIRKLERER
jgi:hypothetical protein